MSDAVTCPICTMPEPLTTEDGFECGTCGHEWLAELSDGVGEVRDAEALDLLKAWGTGHPGGIGTIHAGSGIGALRRLEQLIQEAVVTVPRAMIAETIDLVAVLAGRGSARRLAELARVDGLGPDGDYRISPATSEPDTAYNTGESA